MLAILILPWKTLEADETPQADLYNVHLSSNDILGLARAYALIHGMESQKAITGSCSIFPLNEDIIKQANDARRVDLSSFMKVLIREEIIHGSKIPDGKRLYPIAYRFDWPPGRSHDVTFEYSMFPDEKQGFSLEREKMSSPLMFSHAETCCIEDAYSILRSVLNRNLVALLKEPEVKKRHILNLSKIKIALIREKSKVVIWDDSEPGWGCVVKFNNFDAAVNEDLSKNFNPSQHNLHQGIESVCLHGGVDEAGDFSLRRGGVVLRWEHEFGCFS